MVFMHDDPMVVELAQANGQPEFQFSFFSGRLPSGTAHDRCDERNVSACGNAHLENVKNPGVLSPAKEKVPGLFVFFYSPGFERRWHVEHHDVSRVVSQNSIDVSATNCLGP